MKKARIITKDGYYAQTIEINLEKYSQQGVPSRYIMKKEDTFVLPYRRDSFLGIGLTGAATVVGIITSGVLLYDALTRDAGTTGR